MQGSIARPADTFAQRDWTASAYGLPTDYKERLVKANAYLQKNVGSTSVSLGLYGGNNVADIRKQSLKTVGFTDRQIDAIEKNNLLQISKTSGVSKKSDSSKTAAPTTSNTSSTSGPYGLPADYKERLIKANAYYQKNVGSIPVSLGLHSGSSNYDRSEELRRKSFKEVGFTDAQIDTIERNNLLQTKFEPSKKMSGVKSSRPTYDPNYSWNRTNVNVDPETFQKLAAQQIAQSRQKQQQVSNNVATSKATSDKSGYMDIQVGDQRITRSYDAAGNYTGADTGWQPDTEYSKQVADEISKAVAAARAEYLKSGQTVAQRQQSLEKLQAAIKAGTDYASGQKGFKLPGFGADSKPTASAASDNVTSFLDKMGQVFGGVKDSVVKVSSGIGDGFAVLDDVKKAIQSAEKTGKLIPPSPGSDRPTITPGERGSKENPVQRTLSPSTNKTLTSGINRNMTGKVLRTIIQNNINTDFNFGAKGTINNLTSDPYFNEKGDLVIDDTYAFDPGGDVDKKPFLFGGTTGDFAKSASAALVGSGGEYEKNRVELEKDILTKFDQSIGAVLPDTPGRKDPIIHMRIVIPASQIKESFERKVISEKKLKSPKQVLNNKIPGYYDGKPAPLGFPDNPPPEMVNGMHPDLVDGKKVADRFNRLDPQSAQAMPLTGNPHIDKKVLKARKQPK